MSSVPSVSADTPSFADLTTIGVGGRIASFYQATTRDGLIGAVMDADDHHRPLCVIGGGSNLLASDADFDGLVVRDGRHSVRVETEDGASDAEVEKDARDEEVSARSVIVTADAGVKWDAFVALMASRGYGGIEGLSGIPGTVGASVVQNIGAYGQEVSSSVQSVEVWDREDMTVRHLNPSSMRFGYRTSALKRSMYAAPARPSDRYFPTPRYVVLSVTFALMHTASGTIRYDQLARALGVSLGQRMDISRIRKAVLQVRASKGMLEDPARYASDWMRPAIAPLQVRGVEPSARKHVGPVVMTSSSEGADDGLDGQVLATGIPSEEAIAGARDADRWSCGSFFMNPVLTEQEALRLLPADAPKFSTTIPSEAGRESVAGVKTSAAWLIDHAGFHKGFAIDGSAMGRGAAETGSARSASRPKRRGAHGRPTASLSTLHTLALTNRGGARAQDIAALARTIQKGVEEKFGIHLVPEPVTLGIDLA